jgi:hypothetical protein
VCSVGCHETLKHFGKCCFSSGPQTCNNKTVDALFVHNISDYTGDYKVPLCRMVLIFLKIINNLIINN